MVLLILKIVAGVSLTLFLLTYVIACHICSQLEPVRKARKIPSWDQLALVGRSGSDISASGLINQFKRFAKVLFAAIFLIIFGFVAPYIPGVSFKNLALQYYLPLGVGLIGGWISAILTVRFGNLVKWNLLGIKPPNGVGWG